MQVIPACRVALLIFRYDFLNLFLYAQCPVSCNFWNLSLTSMDRHSRTSATFPRHNRYLLVSILSRRVESETHNSFATSITTTLYHIVTITIALTACITLSRLTKASRPGRRHFRCVRILRECIGKVWIRLRLQLRLSLFLAFTLLFWILIRREIYSVTTAWFLRLFKWWRARSLVRATRRITLTLRTATGMIVGSSRSTTSTSSSVMSAWTTFSTSHYLMQQAHSEAFFLLFWGIITSR